MAAQLLALLVFLCSLTNFTGLSEYDDLGVCGIDEIFEDSRSVQEKTETLVSWLKDCRRCVLHVGAGISTSAGIPDFRGPKGVWTLQQKNQSDTMNPGISFDDARPTFAHRAIKVLLAENLIDFIISQNVDGLFMRTGIDRRHISELHGNFYLDECTICRNRFIRSSPSQTMGLKKSDVKCPRELCRGKLRDTILDWENSIPANELKIAAREARSSDLHICMGSSMQLMPANKLPLNANKKKNGRLVIINLQPTSMDSKADLVIHNFIDECLELMMKILHLDVPDYDESEDPTRIPTMIGSSWTRQKLLSIKSESLPKKSTKSE